MSLGSVTASFNTGSRRVVSLCQRSYFSTYAERLSIFNKALIRAMPSEALSKFKATAEAAEISTQSPTGSMLALRVLSQLPADSLDINLVCGHLGKLRGNNVWKLRHEQPIDEKLFPGTSNKYRTVTSSKVVEFIKRYTLFNKAFSFIEIGCLTAHDARAICKALDSSETSFNKYVGMDLSRIGLIAGACLHKYEPWVKDLTMVHCDAGIPDNFKLPALASIFDNDKLIYCNKLISAVPPNEGTKILKNIATYMKPRDYALINFTVKSKASDNIIGGIKKNPKSIYEVKEGRHQISIYAKPDTYLQRIFDPEKLKKMLNKLGLAPVAIEMISESKQSKHPEIESLYRHDKYDREFMLLAIKEANINKLE